MTAGHRYSGPDAYIWQDCTSGVCFHVNLLPTRTKLMPLIEMVDSSYCEHLIQTWHLVERMWPACTGHGTKVRHASLLCECKEVLGLFVSTTKSDSVGPRSFCILRRSMCYDTFNKKVISLLKFTSSSFQRRWTPSS